MSSSASEARCRSAQGTAIGPGHHQHRKLTSDCSCEQELVILAERCRGSQDTFGFRLMSLLMTRLHAGAYGVGAIVSADARGQEISENSVGFSASQFSDSASAIVLRAPAASPSGRKPSGPQVNLLTLIMCPLVCLFVIGMQRYVRVVSASECVTTESKQGARKGTRAVGAAPRICLCLSAGSDSRFGQCESAYARLSELQPYRATPPGRLTLFQHQITSVQSTY